MFDGFDLFDQLALFQMQVIRTQCQYRDILIFLFGVGVLRVLRKRFHVTIRCGWSPPYSRRSECVVPASNLVSLIVLIFSAQTVKFEDFEGPKSSYFCVPPAIC